MEQILWPLPFFVSLVILYIIHKKGFCVVSSYKSRNVMKKQMITQELLHCVFMS